MTVDPQASHEAVGAELRAALAASGTGTWRWDAATGEVRWDETLEALSGLPPGGFGGTFEAWMETIHPDEIDSIVALVDDAIARRSAYRFEHRTIWPDGSVRWLECRGQVTTDPDGNFTGTVGCATDVTARRQVEEERAAAFERERRLRDRMEFLVQLTGTALRATNHRDLMKAVASTAVPKLGDWCSIHFLPEVGRDIETEVAHTDPEKVEWAQSLAERFPYDPDSEEGVAAVIRTGVTNFIPMVTDEVLDDALGRSDHDRAELEHVLEVLGLTSVITVPMATRRGIVGAMQFVTAESRRVYDEDDVTLAEVAASRVADALDNMWLTEQHRRISGTLQRSLLPPVLPTIPGIEVAVRYWPAGTAVEAGGDFYDVFQTSPTRWSLLIGDVCGTGPDAAALTGIARHTVRAAARHGQDHRAVLEWLNQAMRLSNRDRFCTAIYSTVDSSAGEWRLRTAISAHPRPVLARAVGGEPELLGGRGSLLGVFEEIRLQVVEEVLHVGDLVVFYTDGITDLRPPYGRTENDVAELVGKLAPDRSAGEVAESLHRAVVDSIPPEQPDDDVALVVLRVTADPG